jgi:uncharacterized protein (UPF0333 family)
MGFCASWEFLIWIIVIIIIIIVIIIFFLIWVSRKTFYV